MVSLEARSGYLQEIKTDEYSTALVAFLLNDRLSKTESMSSNANDISKNALFALQTDNKRLFLELYEGISRRKPNQDSEWIYNDTLLFAMVFGVRKFALNKGWLDSVLKIRLEHTQNESLLVTQSFIDLLNDNLINKNNHQPLMLVMKYLLQLPLGDDVYINSIYWDLTQKNFPYSKASFLNIICLKAMDIIILSKGLTDLERQKAVEDFIKTFNSRITTFATAIWVALLLIVTTITVLFLLYFINADSQQAETINRILTFLPLLVFSGLVIPVVFYKNKLITYFKKPFFNFYNFGAGKIIK